MRRWVGGRLAPMTVADYQEYARRTYGELAEAYLATYPAETDEATITARIAAAPTSGSAGRCAPGPG